MTSIVITGATSGIGRALALEYAAPGVHLTLMGRNPERMDAILAAVRDRGAEASDVLVDVQDRVALARALQTADDLHPIDLAIANAGITSGIGGSRDFEGADAVRAVLGINLMGVINTLDPLVERMVMRRRGHLAIVGSLAALRGLPYSPAYSAAKAAIHAYGEGLRPTLRRHGVTLSVIAPGFVRTPLNEDIKAPRPFEISSEAAARRIRHGLDQRRAQIVFPKTLYLGLRLLGLLPARLGDVLLGGQHVIVPETHEKSRD
jgi:short-subunit dehydrogenase